MIVDEPTQGLDPVQKGEVREMLRGLRGERTVILCTHDLDEARSLASQVGVLSEGRLVAVGTCDEVLGRADALDLFRRGAGPPA